MVELRVALFSFLALLVWFSLLLGPNLVRWLLLERDRRVLRHRWTATASAWSGVPVHEFAEGHRAVARAGRAEVQVSWTMDPGEVRWFAKYQSKVQQPQVREELRAMLPRPFDLGMRIVTSSWVEYDSIFQSEVERHAVIWGEQFPYDMCVDDAWLDDRYRFSSYEPMRMLHALTYEVRALLAEIAQVRMHVQVTDDEVIFRRDGEFGGDEEFVRWAVHAMARLVEALGRARVPRAPELRACQSQLLRAAKELQMHFDPRSLAVSGTVRGVRVVFVPRRVGPRHFGLLVRAMLPRQVSSFGRLAFSPLHPLRQFGTVRADERCVDLQLASLHDPRDVMRWVDQVVAAAQAIDAQIDVVQRGGA